MAAERHGNRKESKRQAARNQTKIQRARRTEAQLPQEPAQPEGTEAKIQAPTPLKHRPTSAMGLKPSRHLEQIKKAAMTDSKAGPNGGPSRITRSSSKMSQMGAKKRFNEPLPIVQVKGGGNCLPLMMFPLV